MPSPLLPTRRRDAALPGESWQAWIALTIGVVASVLSRSMVFSVLMKPMLAEPADAHRLHRRHDLRMTLMVLVIAYAGLLTDRIGARAVLVAGVDHRHR